MTAELTVLVVGGGGREHALAWRLAQSPMVGRVLCAPGNAGTAAEAKVTNVAADIKDPRAILDLARRLGVDLTVIGPEDPLAAGVADVLAEAGLAVFGPSRAGARLEWSKAFAKEFMIRHGIPTARFDVAGDPASARAAVARLGVPVVVKADGLAAGKGVTVADDRAQAEEAVRRAMEEGAFGTAGRTLVIEERLEGEEVSVLALTDGERVLPLPPAQDHKRLLDGDRGPNTGGMGAYCPATGVLGAEGERFVLERVLLPAVRGMAREGNPYRGVLYAGLMVTRDGPKVLEFNCRFGDPETQVVLPLLDEDLAGLLLACAGGPDRLPDRPVRTVPAAAAGVVMASGGYPGHYATGLPVDGLEAAAAEPGVKVFHAGTRLEGGRVVTAGGRVLNVVATAPTLREAVAAAYRAVALIRFEGAHWRSDIASRGLGTAGTR